MTFELPHHWVWDFWVADDGALHHLYYLHAPKALGDPELRHRNAVIGHATSADLVTWTDHGPVLLPGEPENFDGSATWTGSVVRGADNLWRMYYTGSRFLQSAQHANIETVGLATSTDLHTWEKVPNPVLSADPRWYETLDDGSWHEEAWRDPWVFQSSDMNWHMLLTARGRTGLNSRDRGVIGYATSPDLIIWTTRPPLSGTDSGFAHLEVPQIVEVDGQLLLLFSCDSTHLTGPRAGYKGGIWYTLVDSATGPYDISEARLLVDERLYAGRIVKDRSGQAMLIGFESGDGADFRGQISDPVPVIFRNGIIQLGVQAGTSPAIRCN